MPSAWITHVKNYASKNNINYSAALKDPKCSQSYKKKVGSGNNSVKPFSNIMPNNTRERVNQRIIPEPTTIPEATLSTNLDVNLPNANVTRIVPEPINAITDPNSIRINTLVKRMNKSRRKLQKYQEDILNTYDDNTITSENIRKSLQNKRNKNIDKFYDDYLELKQLVPDINDVEDLINNNKNILPTIEVLEGGKLKDLKINKEKEILKYSDPNVALDNAIKYLNKNITFALSTKKTKKYMVRRPDGKFIHFGEMGYQDFTKHKDKNKQSAYLKRTANIKGDWKSDKYSANNLARNILWADYKVGSGGRSSSNVLPEGQFNRIMPEPQPQPQPQPARLIRLAELNRESDYLVTEIGRLKDQLEEDLVDIEEVSERNEITQKYNEQISQLRRQKNALLREYARIRSMSNSNYDNEVLFNRIQEGANNLLANR